MATRNLLKVISALCLGLFGIAASSATTQNEWVWLAGSSTVPASCTYSGSCGQSGTYGAITAASTGYLPGARSYPATWTDSSGHLWLFGGYGYDGSGNLGYLNDMWEFYPTTKQWAWMGGVSTIPTCGSPTLCGQPGMYGMLQTYTSGSVPGARTGASSWIDSSGHLWLFGGFGIDANGNYGYLNDLWEFNPTSNEWTWMGGSSTFPGDINNGGQSGIYGTLGTPAATNIPGGRSDATAWTDSNGHFWLFAGSGFDSVGNDLTLDDLWEFNPSTVEWTWMGGSRTIKGNFNPGVYGTLGVPDPANYPGARTDTTSWTDKNGNLWLLGGFGEDENSNQDILNDFWEFNITTSEWTWMGGNDSINLVANFDDYQPGDYGTLGTFAPGNTPAGRSSAASWVDSSGNLWLFAGNDLTDGFVTTGNLNDVWEYDTSSKEWAWMGGNIATCKQCSQPGVYGSLNTPAPSNIPGGRNQFARWTDSSGNLWIFGGAGNDANGASGYLNDLWEYLPETVTPPTITPTVNVAPSPGSITTAQSLTVTVTVNGGNGNPTPTGIVTLTSGSYTSAGTALSGGSAMITVPAGYLLAADDTLTAYYTPDAASSSTYLNAMGSNTVNVAATAMTTPTVDVTPIASSVLTDQALPVKIGVYGNGTLTPTGSIILSGGGYTSASTTLGGGYANITIPAGSMTAGSVTLTANYTPDTASIETYTTASGTIPIVVSVQPANSFDWTWVGGSSTIPENNRQGGVYGTQLAFAAGNYPGGRDNSSFWTDNNGNFWLFGGEGNDASNQAAVLNDLWEFNPSTKEWAWISGSSTGTYNSKTGGNDTQGVYSNMGNFTSGVYPGSRQGASTWVDSGGHLWLFGGYGTDANNVNAPLNDLWEFDPTTDLWAWINGSSTVVEQQGGQPGVYGTVTMTAEGNVPAARSYAASWIDKNGNLWLFGGTASDVDQYSDCYEDGLNDMWEYSPTAKEWTWMGGTEPTYVLDCYDYADNAASGVYGMINTPAMGNIPGARTSPMYWTDSSGNFWLFGGSGRDINGTIGYLDDLWEFNPSANEWTWINGSDALVLNSPPHVSTNYGEPGVYGTLGTFAAGNTPGGRYEANGWVDNSGNFWLIGGIGNDANGAVDYLNDFWEYSLSKNQWTWMGGSSTIPLAFGYGQPGIYGTFDTPAPGDIPGARYNAAAWTDKSGHLWLFGGDGWDSVSQEGWLNDLWEYESATVTPPLITPTVTVTPAQGTITTAQSLQVTITVSGGNGNPTPTGSIVLSSGSYTSASATLISGSVMITIPAGALATAMDTLTATYTPDGGSSSTYNSAMGTNTVTVNAPALITPTVTVTPAHSTITTAQSLQVTITVSGGNGNPTPTGSIVLSSGSYTSASATLVSGSVMITIPAGALATTLDTLTATYTPDGGSSSTYNGAMGTNTVTVTNPALITPTVTVTPAQGSITTTQSLLVTITVNGGNGNPTPTGSIVLSSGSYTSASATLVSGSVMITIPAGSLATAMDTLTANYTPDGGSSSTYNSAMGTNTVTVTAPTVQITVGTSPAGLSFSVDSNTYNSSQTLTWTVGSSHTIATTSPQTTSGTQNTFASWSDSGAISHSVTAPSSATTYTATFTTTYQLTTAASPGIGGTVTPSSGSYYAPGTVVDLMATANSGYTFTNWTGSVASASSASTTVTMNAPESVTANFAVVTSPGFSLTSPTGTQTVPPGGAAQFTITVTAQNGTFPDMVNLAASGLPNGATASFMPTSVTPGSTSASSTLTIQTAPATAAITPKDSRWPLALPAMALVGLLFLPGKRRRRWITLAVLLFATLGAFTSLTACGGGFGFGAGSSDTSYTITVTGTSGDTQQTTTVQLTVE